MKTKTLWRVRLSDGDDMTEEQDHVEQGNNERSTAPTTGEEEELLKISTLPRDALLSILYHLHPSDIIRLDEALPRSSCTRQATQDPCLWRHLYHVHIPRPHSPPILHIRRDGRLDWYAAFQEAIRRQRAVHSRNQINYNRKQTHKDSKKNFANVRIQIEGNVRRIVADASSTSPNITWDSHISAARFDWSRRRTNVGGDLPLRRRNQIVPSKTIPPKHSSSDV